MRRAYEDAQVANDATNPSPPVDDSCADIDEYDDADQSGEERVAATGVLEDTRQRIEQHIAPGMTITWVFIAYDLDHPTVKAIVDNMAAGAGERPGPSPATRTDLVTSTAPVALLLPGEPPPPPWCIDPRSPQLTAWC